MQRTYIRSNGGGGRSLELRCRIEWWIFGAVVDTVSGPGLSEGTVRATVVTATRVGEYGAGTGTTVNIVGTTKGDDKTNVALGPTVVGGGVGNAKAIVVMESVVMCRVV